MSTPVLTAVILLLALGAFYAGRRKSIASVQGNISRLHSLPGHYGWFMVLCMLLPGLLVVALWLTLGGWITDTLALSGLKGMASGQDLDLLLNQVRNLANGGIIPSNADPALVTAAHRYAAIQANGQMATVILSICLVLAGALIGYRLVRPDLAARRHVERTVNVLLAACSGVAILVTIGIVLSLLFETIRFFGRVPFTEFLFGLDWSPQTAIREDQVGSSGAFGVVPLFAGTLLITFIAMLVAVPVGLMSAIYMTYYAGSRFRKMAKPALEILAGVPTVVYGFFAALVVAPFLRGLGADLGLDVASESALAAGLVMGLMIIPFVSSLSDDAITSVPVALRDGAYALGATRSETIVSVVIPAALPGIVGAILLAVSRAVGETMIVVMAAGMAANLTANPLDAVTTITVQIVALLTGDQEFDSAKTLSAFALGLLLFVVTLVLNVAALAIVRKYRERYD